MRYSFLLVNLLIAESVILSTPTLLATEEPPPDSPPNIILIVTDDQRYDTVTAMPRTQNLIFDQGVTFSSAYVTTSLCGPSRASVLTGQYVHNHQVYTNGGYVDQPTFVSALHENGYFTGLVGKYINSHRPDRSDGVLPQPEFDFWVGHGSSDSTPKDFFLHPLLNVNGEWIEFDQYITYLEGDFVQDFLEQAQERDQPFFLLFAPFAPHLPATPAPGDELLYLDTPPYRPPSFNEKDIAGMPSAYIPHQTPLNEEWIRCGDDLRLRQLQSLNSVDVVIEGIIFTLEEQDQLNNTFIFFISDQGVMLGEHRFQPGVKNLLYEEASHVPFAISYPPLVQEAYVEDALVANIDIAPTVYDLAGIPIPDTVDGRSLLPLISTPDTSWRDSIILETWPRGYESHVGIHTARYVYIENVRDNKLDNIELYDLRKDPYQMQNLAGDSAYADIEAELHQKLEDANIPGPPLSSMSNWYNFLFVKYYSRYHLIIKGMLVLIGGGLGVLGVRKLVRNSLKLF